MNKVNRKSDKYLFPSIFNSRRIMIVKLRKQIEYTIDQYIHNGSFGKLVDYGCGQSPYRNLFIPHIEKYICADLDINTRAEIILTPSGELPLQEKSMNIVLSTQVLEHVENPVLYLNEARRVLDENGLLILSTHGYWLFHPTPTDYWRWTSAGLTKIVREAGFEIVYFKGLLGRGAAGMQLLQDSFLFKLPKVLLPVYSMIMQFLVWLIDQSTTQQTRNTDACVYYLIARKSNDFQKN